MPDQISDLSLQLQAALHDAESCRREINALQEQHADAGEIISTLQRDNERLLSENQSLRRAT